MATRPATELTQSEVVTLMAGRRVEEGAGRNGAATVGDEREQPVIELRNVSAGTLKKINLPIRIGEVMGITGVIGAGGQDVARLLYGLSKPDAGEVLFEGSPLDVRSPGAAINRGIFMVPEDPSGEGLVPALSLASNITLVGLPQMTRLGVLSLRKEKRTARRYVEELSIATTSVDTPVRNLSGGNQQKVLLAKALQAGTRVLVLQEPTQGVDVAAKADIHRIIRDLAHRGKAVMVISTDIRDLLLFVDRVVALRAGRIVADVPAAETSYAELLDLTVGSIGAVAS